MTVYQGQNQHQGTKNKKINKKKSGKALPYKVKRNLLDESLDVKLVPAAVQDLPPRSFLRRERLVGLVKKTFLAPKIADSQPS